MLNMTFFQYFFTRAQYLANFPDKNQSNSFCYIVVTSLNFVHK